MMVKLEQITILSNFLRKQGHRFEPCWVRQYSFGEVDHKIVSTVDILSLQLIQEGQLSVSGERM